MPDYPHSLSSYFNSTLVRLKAQVQINETVRTGNFNSTLVRLKVISRTVCYNSNEFQFHIGTIKRVYSLSGMKDCYVFQFHIGTIKRKLPETRKANPLIFQFHIGTIKSSGL